MKKQTLLGATATGKSLGYTDPVFVVEKCNGKETPRVREIGPLIDGLMESHSSLLRQDDTTILDAESLSTEYYAQAFNPSTCVVELFKIFGLYAP